MQKISKQLSTFIDHRQKGESLWLKKFEKISVIKFKKKRGLGLTEIKFRKLVSIKSSVSEMHLRVPVETQQFRTVDLSELDLPFLFIREWNGRFVNLPDFWFTFPYHPNVGPILDRFAGFRWIFPYPCVNATPPYRPFGTDQTVPV